ncbi:glycine-rich cell wall structural protein 1.0 [Jatropha curcas]|uniref:glycine-rich cell wall structural protein 1.0 n=1 Tax=Jatropha curcas TaxID=180498 RepID=UPI00189381F9|nr:glycine-rich cell wall structural protein 1.0 [Jatropha curcas]
MMMMGGGRAATNNYGMGGGNYGMRGGGVAANNYGMGGGNYGMRGGGAATNNYGIRGGNYGMTGGGLATNNYEIGGGRAATNNYGIGGGRAATNNYGIGGGQAAINHYGMINRMGNVGMGNIGSNLLGGQNLNSWAYDMGSSSTRYGKLQSTDGHFDGTITKYATGIPAYQNINGGLTLPPFQPHSLTSYTLLDCSPFKARQTGKSSSVARRPRNGNNINPHRRCTNYNCNTNDTPMWRKGPLGPKSLCNACGIKYRKEAEKRKAKEAAKDSKA